MFTEIIVAIYETDEDAEAAVAEMVAAHVPQSAIQRHTKADVAAPGADPRGASEPEHGGFWSRLFGGHSHDHAVYDHALHNGGNVVTVTTVPNHDFAPVMAILERHSPIDVDERAASFVGIAHTASTTTPGSEPMVNQGGARVRRFAVTPPAREA